MIQMFGRSSVCPPHLLLLLLRGGSVLLPPLPSPYLLHRLTRRLHSSPLSSHLPPVWTPPLRPHLLASDHAHLEPPPVRALSFHTHPVPPSLLPPRPLPFRPRLLRGSTPPLCSGGAVGGRRDPRGGGLPPRGGRRGVPDGGRRGGALPSGSAGSSPSTRQNPA